MDDSRVGPERKNQTVPTALDGGALGRERKLYFREMIARFGHLLALNWNLGEENTQSTAEHRAMARFIGEYDPYNHNIVLHTYPQEQDRVYTPLLGTNSVLTGVSLQNDWNATHQRTLQWVKASAATGKPWVVANDEQGPADLGVPPDPGYKGHSGEAKSDRRTYTMHDIRKQTLWGNLMAGGAGVEYYFGYKLPQNDLGCEDFRSRDKTWDYGRFALEFFHKNKIPFWEMKNENELLGENSKNFCLAKKSEVYVVFLPDGGSADLYLPDLKFTVERFNPRTGGDLEKISAERSAGKLRLTAPENESTEDWAFLVRKSK